MRPTIRSCETTNAFADASTLSTIPLTTYSLSAACSSRLTSRATAHTQMPVRLPRTTSSKRQRLAVQRGKAIRHLANFNHLVLGNIGKYLTPTTGRPVDLDLDDA